MLFNFEKSNTYKTLDYTCVMSLLWKKITYSVSEGCWLAPELCALTAAAVVQL